MDYFVNEGNKLGYMPTTMSATAMVEKKIVAKGVIAKGDIVQLCGDLEVEVATAASAKVLGVAMIPAVDKAPVSVECEGLFSLKAKGTITAGQRVAAFGSANNVCAHGSGASVKGVYTIKIGTAATAGDTLTIDGVTYTAAATEDVAAKEFAVGASAAAQVTSLLKMIVSPNYVASATAGATDTITLTEKNAGSGIEPEVSVVKVASTGALVATLATVTVPVSATDMAFAIGIAVSSATDGQMIYVKFSI